MVVRKFERNNDLLLINHCLLSKMYYMITSAEDKLHLFSGKIQMVPGINVAAEPLFYFTTKQYIHQFYYAGVCLWRVELPEDDDQLTVFNYDKANGDVKMKIPNNIFVQTQFTLFTNKIILCEKYDLTDLNIYSALGMKMVSINWAINKNLHDLVKTLLIEFPDEYSTGYAFVHFANAENFGMLEFLLENCRNVNVNEVIHQMICCGNTTMVKYFVKKWQDYQLNYNNYVTSAIIYGLDDLLHFFLEQGAVIESPDTQFSRACHIGYLETVKFFVNNGIDILGNNNAIATCIINGRVNILKYLLSVEPSITFPDCSFYKAILHDHKDMAMLLIEQGIDLKVNSKLSLVFAVLRDYSEIVQLILDHGANIGDASDIAMRIAAKRGDLAMVKLLVENGISIYTKNNTSIEYYYGDENSNNIVDKHNYKLVLEAGNPFCLACMWDHVDVAEYLVQCGVDVPSQGNELFFNCCRRGKLEIVQLLVRYGMDFHANNEAALVYSCFDGHLDVVKFLVENGADIYTYEYALGMANNGCHDKIATYLLEKGAVLNNENNIQPI